MSRAQRVIDDTAVQRILDTAAACFYRHGYTGTTLRAIAAEAKVSVGTLYKHFPSKQAVLAEIVDATQDALIVQTEAAVAVAGEDPAARLEAAVWAQCDFYAGHRCSAFVANIELRSLEPANREHAEGKSRHLNDLVAEIIRDGVERGVFEVDEPAAVSRALLSMCTAVASWQEAGHNEAARHVARTYCGLAERMTALRSPAAAAVRPRTTRRPVVGAHS